MKDKEFYITMKQQVLERDAKIYHNGHNWKLQKSDENAYL